VDEAIEKLRTVVRHAPTHTLARIIQDAIQ
jgi:hypothetical protein